MPAGSNPNSYLTSGGFNQFAQGLGLGSGGGGWNPAMPLQRRGAVGLGNLALQQTAFANELEPMRQGFARQFLMNLNPANTQARIDALMRRGRAGAARQQSMDASMAPFMGINPASLAAYNSQSDQNAARMGQQMNSPQGMASAYGQGMGLIGQMQDPSMLMALAQLTGATQQENQSSGQNVPSQGNGLGGLLGSLGQFAGMGGFGNMFGGQGGGGVNNQGFMNQFRNMNFGGGMRFG